ESVDGAAPCEPSCPVLESDFLLNGELEFGLSEMEGLDRDVGVTVFSLSAEDNEPSAPTAGAFPALLSCKGCGLLLGDTPLGAGLGLGVGLDLGTELYCLSCDEKQQNSDSTPSPQEDPSHPSTRKKKPVSKDGVPPKLFSCSLCTFASCYSNHLKRHMRIHDGQKPYCCPVCPYASAQLVNLQRHLRTHTGEKPYRCPQCSYACSSLGNLRRHQRMHTQEKWERLHQQPLDHILNRFLSLCSSELTLRVSQDSSYLRTLGGLGAPSGPLPVLLFPLCCRLCGLTLEEADLEGEKDGGEVEAEREGGQVCRRCKDGPPRRGRRGSKLYRCPHCPFLSHYPNHLSRHSQTHCEVKKDYC
ncbi:zinc finger protein 513-like, partial [Cyprinodon tularosa]|uniref:zinc finger protein 513-like n=1 Tax=Cyprinodon tularosa TaxID=77115 RepID=UPI0018E23CC3